MKRIYRKRGFWLLILFIIIIGVWIWLSNRTIDGSKGGKLEGPSHSNGGIDGIIRNNGEKISLEGGEDVLTKKVKDITDQYICYGTPEGIASEINVIGEGVKFADGGKCVKR